MNGFNTKEAKDTMRKCTYPLAGSLRGATASMAPDSATIELQG